MPEEVIDVSAYVGAVREQAAKALSQWLEDEREAGRESALTGEDRIAQLSHQTEMIMQDMPLSREEKDRLVKVVVGEIYGLRELDELLYPPLSEEISNIEIVGYDKIFVTYRDERGREQWSGKIGDSDDDLIKTFEKLAGGRAGGRARPWSDKDFVLNCKLITGHRVHAIRKVATRPAVTIRAHDMGLSSLSALVEKQMLTPNVSGFLQAAVRGKANVIVSGAVNCGKTTLLRALLNEVTSQERLVTIEDNLELGIASLKEQHPNTVELEAVPPNLEGVGGVTMSMLLKESMRMNPDRVIVGEVRGGEMISMIQAMTQGNSGSMCSIHANSAEQSIRRMMLYAQQSTEVTMTESTSAEAIIDAVDMIVYVTNDSGFRFVSEVCEVVRSPEGGPMAVSLFTMKLRHDNPDETVAETNYYYNHMSAVLRGQLEPWLQAEWDGWDHWQQLPPWEGQPQWDEQPHPVGHTSNIDEMAALL